MANWTKVTCRKRETFVVAGIAYKGNKFDGVYLPRREGDFAVGRRRHHRDEEQRRSSPRPVGPSVRPYAELGLRRSHGRIKVALGFLISRGPVALAPLASI
jgi:bifunctional non-homologous end joining protein LigD